MSYYSMCPGCGKQHHASFPYCEHCGGYVRLDLSEVVLVNKQFRPTQDPLDGAKRRLTGRNGKPTNVLADGTLDPAPPVI